MIPVIRKYETKPELTYPIIADVDVYQSKTPARRVVWAEERTYRSDQCLQPWGHIRCDLKPSGNVTAKHQ